MDEAMNNTEARIRLAEWMGLDDNYTSLHCRAPFDPYTNDADCMALEMELSRRGWAWEEHRQSVAEFGEAAGVWLEIWHYESEVHHRWDGALSLRKQGVCELADKVIDDVRGS